MMKSMMKFISDLSPRAAGVLAIVGVFIVLPLPLAFFFWQLGVLGRAWHWMLAGFAG